MLLAHECSFQADFANLEIAVENNKIGIETFLYLSYSVCQTDRLCRVERCHIYSFCKRYVDMLHAVLYCSELRAEPDMVSFPSAPIVT